MLYNELEQGDILSGVRWRLALLAYTDILLCSIWAMRRIRQTPGFYQEPACRAPERRWAARHSLAAERVLGLAAAREPCGAAPVSWHGAPSDVAHLRQAAP